MKFIRYCLLSILVAGMFTACDSNRNKATLGGTQDTSKVIGSASGGTRSDSIPPKLKDSVKGGNANPSGRLNNDSVTLPK